VFAQYRELTSGIRSRFEGGPMPIRLKWETDSTTGRRKLVAHEDSNARKRQSSHLARLVRLGIDRELQRAKLEKLSDRIQCPKCNSSAIHRAWVKQDGNGGDGFMRLMCGICRFRWTNPEDADKLAKTTDWVETRDRSQDGQEAAARGNAADTWVQNRNRTAMEQHLAVVAVPAPTQADYMQTLTALNADRVRRRQF
jgi:hypothetical protein